VDAEYSSVHDVEVDNTQRRKNMIQLDGVYHAGINGVVVEKFEDMLADYPLDDRYARDIVTTNNANIQAYSDEFAEQVEDAENIDFGDWIKYNTGLMPYIKRAADTVNWLHKNGYTEYKVNMQSGMIVE
jgi:hypothetical protein